MEVYRTYFEKLEERNKLFRRALEIAREIGERAEKLLGECEVYIVGSFARGEQKLSSDLDILIVSQGIPDKLEFEWYYRMVKRLSGYDGVNIHLLSPSSFKKFNNMYKERLKVL